MYVGLNRSAEELGITEYSTLVMSDCDLLPLPEHPKRHPLWLSGLQVG